MLENSVVMEKMDTTGVIPDDEYNVFIPSMGTRIYMQDAYSNLDDDDYAAGYDASIDYEIVEGENEGDGGVFAYKTEDMATPSDWTSAISACIKFIFELADCPDYELEEVE